MANLKKGEMFRALSIHQSKNVKYVLINGLTVTLINLERNRLHVVNP